MISVKKNLLLQKLRKIQALPFVDFALSDHLLKDLGGSHDLEPLILHLSQAMRNGHLCIIVNSKTVFPKPKDIWEIDEHYEMTHDEWLELEQLISASVKCIPPNLISVLTSAELNHIPMTPLCRMGDLYYFQKYWVNESTCLAHFFALSTKKPTLKLNKEEIQSFIDQNPSLMPEQALAITHFQNQCLTLITGGPGTGKTYTAGLLIKAFWCGLTNSQRDNCRIVLGAPTGKATTNLQKSLEKAVADIQDFPRITAATIHRLLGPPATVQEAFIPADLLVLDECSMIDISLMARLLKALKPGARLIMLGDPFQLPPVGVGSFFSDMNHLSDSTSRVELKKCLRTDLKEIVNLAREIKKGESQAALHLLNTCRDVLQFCPMLKETTPLQIQRQLWDKAWPHLSMTLSAAHISVASSPFCLLSSLRKGPLGVEQLNAFFYKEMQKKAKGHQLLAVPIIITTNDSKRELFNGDIGFLYRQGPFDEDKQIQIGDYAIFSGRKIPALLLPRYEYAYCVSIHKSQGSEFDHVLVILPEGSANFGRELIYTAVTRARKQLEIWSTPELFEKVLQRSSARLSRCGDQSGGQA